MSAHPQAKFHDTATGGLGQALYFKSGADTLFGWLHRPSTPSNANLSLVICNPFGYEAMCAHRSVRAFAEAASELGIPALRFDYLGTGDSADIEPHADHLEIWTLDVLAAIAELQRSTGVQQVCLLGIRFGGLRATLASKRCAAVTSLVL